MVDTGPAPGARAAPLGASPFAATVPALVSAVLFGGAALVWLVAGRWLPGGRWVVVHLFTLGVLTSVIAAFTRHFSLSFTGQGAPRGIQRPLVVALVLDLSVLALLVGRLSHGRVLLAIGTLGLLAVVGDNLWGLRTARRSARVARFTSIVRRYEDAHAAFLIAAVLGTLVGTGAVRGGLYVGARDAHLHLNVLGWAGLTVLATLVVFGPALLRVRIGPGVEERVAAALRWAAGALFAAAVWLVLASWLPGAAGTAMRMAATAALLVYGWGVFEVASTTLASARRSTGPPPRLPVMAAVLWLPVGVLVDVIAVATAQRRLLDVVGVVLFVGVLTQLILAVMMHLAPHLRGSDTATRTALRQRLQRLAVPRAVFLNLGVAAVALGLGIEAVSELSTAGVVRAGWGAIALGILAHLAPVLRPVGAPSGGVS